MDKVPYLLKRDVFSDEQLRLIFDELQFLNNSYLMQPPENTASARDHGNLIKNNKGVFLRNVYCREDASSIIRLLKDKLEQYVIEYSNVHITNLNAAGTNELWFLVSYYENADYYKPHEDATLATALFWFNKEPRKFTGGDLTFNNTDEFIEYKNNSFVIFPGWATHSVSPVLFNGGAVDKTMSIWEREGRYCVTVGMHIVPK